MKMYFTVAVDCSSGTYEAELADDRGALNERAVPKACAVVRAVLDHLEAGRAETVYVDRDRPAVSRGVPTPPKDSLN
jgi:hypothetical protein